MGNILVLDNFDSFIYNLVDPLRVNGHKVLVLRNKLPVSAITKVLLNMKNPILMLSPGPGIPSQAGCMSKLLQSLYKQIPIIGICLGHQAIIELYGGNINRSENIVHGKPSPIYHDHQNMFSDIPNPFIGARYHSLIATTIPSMFTVNAYYKKNVMAIRNNEDRVCGFQFHPESILTPQGTKILNNTLAWALY